MKVYLEFKEKKYKTPIFWLNLIIFVYNIEMIISSSCNYTHPIKKGGICTTGECSKEYFDSNICTIENDIINDQWLSNIIIFTEKSINYATLATTPNGDLICTSTYYSSSTKKYYYGLKKNGRPYFLIDSIETYFATSDSNQTRNEGNIYAIKLSGSTDNKEYVIAFANNNANFELYDFDNNNVYYQSAKSFFQTSYNNFHYGTILKLNTNDSNYYIISFIGRDTNYDPFLYIKKLLFTELDITTYSPIIKENNLTIYNTKISSCFESEGNYIICFYLYHKDNYAITALDYDLNILATDYIYSIYYSDTTFYKCVHFTNYIGAFLYYDIDRNISIQFKKYYNSEFISPFNDIKIKNNDNYLNQTKYCDFIKINDKKICFAVTTSDKKELNLFIISNYIDGKIKIRHYNIKIYNLYLYLIKDELNLSVYNEFIALACTLSKDYLYGSLIIFSYPNSTDFNIDITDNLTSFTNPIIKLYEKCNIENNIFGYFFVGIKIIDFTDGLTLIDNGDKEVFPKDCVIPNTTEIEIILTNKTNLEKNERIEYAMVTMESEYDIYNQYPIEIDNTYCGDNCDDENINFRHWHFGRTSYCNIILNSDKLSNDCNDDNCVMCIKEQKTCIVCKYLFELIEGGGKKCLNENEIPQTYVSDLTEKTTIQNIKTTIPNIKTTIQNIKTTIQNIETTIPNIKTTIPNIKTTIPNIKTTILNIKTTIPNIKTTISNIKTTIQNIKTTISNIKTTIPNIKTTISNIKTTIPNIKNKSIETTIFKNLDTIIKGNITINNETNCIIEKLLNNECKNKEITLQQIDEIKNNLLKSNNTKENTIIKTKNVMS